jgi:radical SAM superfamily enzyme YgiQ (UPF0313 family)
MNILLIAPASGKWRYVGKSKLFNGKTFRFSLLSLLSISAETPEEHTIRIIDEQHENIPWNESFDLVGITCMTALAPRAYEIADHFRQKGIPVILGGMHPSFLPQEALLHANAVVIGEAEGVWKQVLIDVHQKTLKKIYRSSELQNIDRLKLPPYRLLKMGRYSTYAVQATRGCSNRCAFCSVTAFHRNCQRYRPVEEVIREISQIPTPFFIFVDDNLISDREYALQLFSQLKPLQKKWVTQASLDMTNDPEFIQQAADAGCVGVFIGLETFSNTNLNGVNKTCHKVQQYRQAIQLLHSKGIGVEAGIVFGFENDDDTVFERTLSLLNELEIDAVQVSIMTPMPGTPLYDSMKDQILDHHWDHYDFHHVIFKPKRMSVESLQAGHDWVTHQFYKPTRMLKRFRKTAFRPNGFRYLYYSIALNLAYYGRTRSWHIKGWNPAKQNTKNTENFWNIFIVNSSNTFE